MTRNEVLDLCRKEASAAFSGWDFSYINGRIQREPLPWDYRRLVLERLKDTDTLLDIGTGGGEFLLSLSHPFGRTAVTEAWPPNVKLCREKLSPLGICVVEADMEKCDRLPFEDGRFDIVIDRHENYDLSEIFRLLKPGGYFITQQVGSENNRALADRLVNSPSRAPFSLESELPRFRAARFDVEIARESALPARYLDIGALAFMARALPWEFPGFSADACAEKLFLLQKEIEQNGYIEGIEYRFVIVSRKREENP